MPKVLLFGEPLIRITPLDFQSLGNQTLSKTYFGGSEVNIACNLQALGVPTKVFTGLPNNEIGDRFLHFLNQHSIDTSDICRAGERIGLYYLENGYGCRQSEVFYDRKYSSINNINIEDLDLENLFHQITHFHFSGITVAISQHVRQLLLFLLEEAQKREIIISMDLNLRTKMISIFDAKYQFSKFAAYANYCFGIEPLMVDNNDLTMFAREKASLQDIEERMKRLRDTYCFKAIFHTIRSTDEYGRNVYQAYALGESFEISRELKTAVLQRVGSGDAFISGALYKLLTKASLKETIDFAVASASLKCSVEGDSMSHSVKDIEKLLLTTKDIIR